jgi:hypothetical protein
MEVSPRFLLEIGGDVATLPKYNGSVNRYDRDDIAAFRDNLKRDIRQILIGVEAVFQLLQNFKLVFR